MGGRSTDGGGGGGEGEYRGEEEGTLRVTRELECSFQRCGRLLLKSADFVRTNLSFR